MVILLLSYIFPFFFHPYLLTCLFIAGLTWVSFSFFKKKIILFIYFFIFGCSGSFFTAWALSSCREQGLLSIAVQVSHGGGPSCWGALGLGHAGPSQVLEHRLSSCRTWI